MQKLCTGEVNTDKQRDFCLRRFLSKTKKNLKTKNPKMEQLPYTKKQRLVADSTLDHTSAWGGRIKQNDDWKFHGYKKTNLGYNMMCESINSDQEEKEGDVLNGNRIINLNNLITNIDIFWYAKIVHRRGKYR